MAVLYPEIEDACVDHICYTLTGSINLAEFFPYNRTWRFWYL